MRSVSRVIRPLLASMYLAPFPRNSIDDLPTAQWCYQLMCMLQTSLRRLVIDIDIRFLTPWQDHLSILPTSESAFEQLENIEEFTSARDDLALNFLPSQEALRAPLWTRWTQLRKLSLYGAPVAFWMTHNNCIMLNNLTHLVLNRSTASISLAFRDLLMAQTSRKLRILIIDESTHTEHRKPINSFNEHSIRTLGNEPPIVLVGMDLPIGIEPAHQSLEEWRIAYQDWVMDEAIAGTLWNLGGLFLGERREALVQPLA